MAKSASPPTADSKLVLLSGGNPHIAKGYGDEPVQAYIAALPGWKQDAARQLDALITQTIPSVCKAVKWNSPLYGMSQGVWFLGLYTMTKYLKIAFFDGAQLSPLPPVTSTQTKVRYWHVAEGEIIDETQFINWINQASQLPG